ncbi:hypothetical protein ACFVH9_08570 [Streptomyces hirsutus]|uniref:hypothetical protein n=1 Tax=Streptomyces hirsutus TaxID=35620 RepID=UPI00363A9FF8
MNLTDEKSVRDFLRLCLDPGHGIKRTPAKLTEVMPDPLYQAMVLYAPRLGRLRADADRQDKKARAARKAYADAVAAWIHDKPAPAEDEQSTDRREKYAQTLYATLEEFSQERPWADLSPLRRAVWYTRADEAIALADGEIREAALTSAPERIDRIRPEFQDHASPESIDVQLRRAKRQCGMWENRVAKLAALKTTRLAQIEAGIWPSPAGEDTGPVLCPQNRRGDKVVQEEHFYAPDDTGVQRCVFCKTAPHQGGEPARAYRTPDGRVWTLAAEQDEHGVPLYEAPFINKRYTALQLETMHGEIAPAVDAPLPQYVYNARSVNRTTKHIADGEGHTMCPSSFHASKPMREEEAARLALCNGCRRALVEAAHA